MTIPYRDQKHRDIAELERVLVGRRVIKAEFDTDGYDDTGRLTLDDGTVLHLEGNTGGCICGAGDYRVSELNTYDAAVMGVRERVTAEESGSPYYGGPQTYEIFVLGFDNSEHLLASFDGDDGNGYYGTGWWFAVVDSETSPENETPPIDSLTREDDSES